MQETQYQAVESVTLRLSPLNYSRAGIDQLVWKSNSTGSVVPTSILAFSIVPVANIWFPDSTRAAPASIAKPTSP